MILLGHRGARFEAPENTLPGFRYAIDLGLEAVEFDLRLTRDGEVVVIHDETVDRTTNGTGAVADLTLAEIQRLDARSIFPDWPEPCTVPTFGEVLDVVGVLPRMEVEIKADTTERMREVITLATAEARRRGLHERVTFTSFQEEALEMAREIAPEIKRGFIGTAETQAFLDTAVRLGVARIGARNTSARPEIVAKARSLGMLVVGWPTNTPEDLETVRRFGMDLACTDAPTLIRELIDSPAGSVAG